ncbi:MAG: transporter [Sphingobacteriales bacterium]|nr:transporter [Sphingobacteriales bacterium]
MNFSPSDKLTTKQIRSGLNLVVADGVATEAMVALTAGTFLVAIAIHLGASNFQLGLLAAMPTFTSVFQLVSVWLVHKFKNRRAISVLGNFSARFPLLIIGFLPFLFSKETSLSVMIYLLFFHYFFGAIGGASWNSWMKDLVPEKILGTYFSHRGRLAQILNVSLSLLTAFSVDYIQIHFPQYEITAYSLLFIVGGSLGLLAVYFLSKTPEPKANIGYENVIKLMHRPLKDKNFRSLLIFNSFWSFALNLATPFFTVYMMKTLGLSLSYVIALGLLGQLSTIFSIKIWGRYSDKYSNKTIINICAPIYVCCLIAWAFVTLPTSNYAVLSLLAVINIFSGIATSGINLAITHIGIKLAPKEEGMVYLSARNIIVALFSAVAPMIGGLMADFFASHELVWNIEWTSSGSISLIPLIKLQGWNFFFLIGGILAMFSLRFLKSVKENGEIGKEVVFIVMRKSFGKKLKRGIQSRSVQYLYATNPVSVSIKKKINSIGNTQNAA